MTTKPVYGTSELAKEFGELTFGNALSSYRLGENKSQREFAKFLEISAQSLCDIEKGRMNYPPSSIMGEGSHSTVTVKLTTIQDPGKSFHLYLDLNIYFQENFQLVEKHTIVLGQLIMTRKVTVATLSLLHLQVLKS